jgi:hypothetical protein
MMPDEKTRYLTNRANWSKARPQNLPRPTYWPFFLAAGLALLVWGILAGWIIGTAGLVVMIIALTGWITELRHEQRENND